MVESSSAEPTFWEAIEILDQKGPLYLVAWAGTDPDTGKQYDPTWEPKENCTRALLDTWAPKKARKAKSTPKKERDATSTPKRRPKSLSISSTPVPSEQGTPRSVSRRKVSSRQSTATPADRKAQTTEYTPTRSLPRQENASSPSLRKTVPVKRKASINVVVPKKPRPASTTPAPKPDESKKGESVPEDDVESTEEEVRVTKKRKLVRKVVEDSQPEDEQPPPIQSDKPLDIVSISSQSSAKEAPPQKPTEPAKEPSPPKEPSQPPSRGRSASRQPTPARQRSLSPTTKVDTWFTVSTAKAAEEAQPENPVSENIYSGTVSEIVDPPTIESEMNSNQQMNPNPPTFGFTPVQMRSRQQSGQASPVTPVLNQSLRSPSQSHGRRGSSVVSFSSVINLKERFQGTTNLQAHEEIRKLTSYPKKTPSLASSATGASLLSTNTTVSSASTTLSNLRLVTLGENEHILAVSSTPLQARMSRGVVVERQREIRAFCLNAEDTSEETVTQMRGILEHCSSIATHPYSVVIPNLGNVDLPERDEAKYLANASGKFVALGKILDALREGGDGRVGIVVGNARGMEMVEGFVRGKGIKLVRTDGAGMRDPQVVETRGLTVTLVLGGRAGSRALVNRVDVVIAMDLSFNQEDDQILRLRQHPINVDQLSPVIRLVTLNSSEHVRLCLPSPHIIPSDRTALQALVVATTLLRKFTELKVPNEDTRYAAVAAFIREKRETDVFGIRDVSSYVVGHRGLAGLALKRARSPTAEEEPSRKRLKTEKALWQLPSMESIQRENDELRASLADKQLATETLRTELTALTTKLHTLEQQNTNLETRLEKSQSEFATFRLQIDGLSDNDTRALSAQILKLRAAFENKGLDFDYVAARYQEASASAAEAQGEIVALREEVERLSRRVEGGVREVAWEGERTGLVARIAELEGRCRILEERERKMGERESTMEGQE